MASPPNMDDTQELEIELARRKRRDNRSRWFEIGISVAASALVSAVTVTWSLSATLTSFREQLNDHGRRMAITESQTAIAVSELASLKARQDGDDRGRVELDARLQRIEQKLDTVIERGRR